MKAYITTAMLALLPALGLAQVPVDEDGKVVGQYEPATDGGRVDERDNVLLSDAELRELVGPIALYPDDLLAVVLPASAYPLQIVEAARFIEALEGDSSLQPDPDWDDSVVALTNYPEVIELLNNDLDWTARLGDAVVAQQTDVVAAVESFRDQAYAAGNLKSDSYQNVEHNDGVIEITPVSDDAIYVPYYEPERVVVYQPRPVYYYHPRPYPVYYYPYASDHYFNHGYFWGVTTAFTIGWYSDSLNVYHHSYHGHPYYGRTYWNNWWYRRPSINVYNTTYFNRGHARVNRYRHGDRWRAQNHRREYVVREGYRRRPNSGSSRRQVSSVRQQAPIKFRQRSDSHPSKRLRANTSKVPGTRQTTQRRDRSTANRQTSVRTQSARTARQPAQRTARTSSIRQSSDRSQRSPRLRQSDRRTDFSSNRRRSVAQAGRTQTTRQQRPVVSAGRAPTARQHTIVRTERKQASRPSAQRTQRAPETRQSSRAPVQRQERRKESAGREPRQKFAAPRNDRRRGRDR